MVKIPGYVLMFLLLQRNYWRNVWQRSNFGVNVYSIIKFALGGRGGNPSKCKHVRILKDPLPPSPKWEHNNWIYNYSEFISLPFFQQLSCNKKIGRGFIPVRTFASNFFNWAVILWNIYNNFQNIRQKRKAGCQDLSKNLLNWNLNS